MLPRQNKPIQLADETPLAPPTIRDVERRVKQTLSKDTKQLVDHTQKQQANKQRLIVKPDTQSQPASQTNHTDQPQPSVQHPAADVSNISENDLRNSDQNKDNTAASQQTDKDKSFDEEAKKLLQAATKEQLEQPLIIDLDEKAKKEAIEGAAKDSLKDSLKEVQKSTKKLDDLMEQNDRIIYQTSAVFPFDMFPDRIVVYENKVDIILKRFFFTETVRSAELKNISEVVVNTSLFFSSMKIVAKNFADNEITITHLKTEEAKKVRHLIEGLTSMIESGIDISKLPIDQLVSRAEKLGGVKET